MGVHQVTMGWLWGCTGVPWACRRGAKVTKRHHSAALCLVLRGTKGCMMLDDTKVMECCSFRDMMSENHQRVAHFQGCRQAKCQEEYSPEFAPLGLGY